MAGPPRRGPGGAVQPPVAKFESALGRLPAKNLVCSDQIDKEVLSLHLGENICRLRTARNMSQGDLAEALDVSRQSISKWETGGAVPELDKLMKLSALFGVTLDELVTGEAVSKPAAPEMTPQAAPEHRGTPVRRAAGIALLCVGLSLAVLFAAVARLPEGLLLSSPLWICGIICLAAKRHPALWCLWAVFLLADAYLRYATGLSWAVVRWTLQWSREMNYTRLAIAWCQLLCALALLCGTVWRLGRAPLEKTQKNRRLFRGGCALLVLLCLPLGAWLFQAGGDALLWLIQPARCILDLLRLALAAALLTCLWRWRRGASHAG